MFSRLAIACTIAALATATGPAHASDKYIDVIKASVGQQCIPNVQQMTSRPELADIYAQHPVDTDKVCNCAVAGFLADKKLHDALMVDDKILQPRLQAEPLKSYMSLRITNAVYKCLTPEIDGTLSAVQLETK